ncbi:hypothetical protein BTUL_0201g00060 [Botrytis tulipae]|uniref:Uncharacterized protein n=1 Tax=Botrytis tulipae TaxID=87230 RepID=A0A4Z1ECZ2_9HELO|nr:hypothetical protein BTUL_0201g00060 [Botrytis tulipae]
MPLTVPSTEGSGHAALSSIAPAGNAIERAVAWIARMDSSIAQREIPAAGSGAGVEDLIIARDVGTTSAVTDSSQNRGSQVLWQDRVN